MGMALLGGWDESAYAHSPAMRVQEKPSQDSGLGWGVIDICVKHALGFRSGGVFFLGVDWCVGRAEFAVWSVEVHAIYIR